MAQIFHTEAIQSIARGDGKRLKALLDAGLNADAVYGSGDDGGHGSGAGGGGGGAAGSDGGELAAGRDEMRLVGWARALGQDNLAEMLLTYGGASTGGGGGGSGGCGCSDSEDGGDRSSNGGGSTRSSGIDTGARQAALEERVADLRCRIDGLAEERARLERLLEDRGALKVVAVLREARMALEAASAEAEAAAAGAAAMQAELRREQVAMAALQRDIVCRAADLQACVGGSGSSGQRARQRLQSPSPPRHNGHGGNDSSDVAGDNVSGEEAAEVAAAAAAARRLEERQALADQLERMAADLSQEVRCMAMLATGEGGAAVAAALTTLRRRAEDALEDATASERLARYVSAQTRVLFGRSDELRRQLHRMDDLLAGARAAEEQRAEVAAAPALAGRPAAGEGCDATSAARESLASREGMEWFGALANGALANGGAATVAAAVAAAPSAERLPLLPRSPAARAATATAVAGSSLQAGRKAKALAPRIMSAYDEEELRQLFEAEEATGSSGFWLTVIFAMFGWRDANKHNPSPILMA
ncbi:unnamed protein product [Phaeothamnion confervicola]